MPDNTAKPATLYRTSDLYYAAFLKVAAVPFHGTAREGTRVYFLFDEGDGVALSDLKAQYFNRTAKVVAMTFADEVKAMKYLTHAGM